MNPYLQNVLLGQQGSIIKKPINPECQLAVLIPVFDEDIDTLLTPLLSLANQLGVSKNKFEVVVVVNNNKEIALKNEEGFLKNQTALKLLNFFSGESSKHDLELTLQQQENVNKINGSGLVLNVIDKSSLNNADDYNNVGIAKNRAGAEICQRFFSSTLGEKGIIALTDCDCWFSENYIAEIIETYQTYDLNGLSGGLEFIPDPELKYGDLVLKVLRLQHGQSPNARPAPNPPKIFFQKKDKIKTPLILDSQNMTVTVKTWLAVFGMPAFASWENKYFVREVSKLSGEMARNFSYTVYSWARASKRAGLTSFGRRVYEAELAVVAYKEGRSKGIYLQNEQQVANFFSEFFTSCTSQDFNGDMAYELIKTYGFLKNDILPEQMQEIVNEYRKELSQPVSKRHFDKFEHLVLDYLYPYFPQMDITKNPLFKI